MGYEDMWARWEQQNRDEAIARDSLRAVLAEHHGPWRYWDLEAKARQTVDVGAVATRDALWSLIRADEAVMGDDGIYAGNLGVQAEVA